MVCTKVWDVICVESSLCCVMALRLVERLMLLAGGAGVGGKDWDCWLVFIHIPWLSLSFPRESCFDCPFAMFECLRARTYIFRIQGRYI